MKACHPSAQFPTVSPDMSSLLSKKVFDPSFLLGNKTNCTLLGVPVMTDARALGLRHRPECLLPRTPNPAARAAVCSLWATPMEGSMGGAGRGKLQVVGTTAVVPGQSWEMLQVGSAAGHSRLSWNAASPQSTRRWF